MNHVGKYFTVSACALATAAFLSACGGGESGAPFSPTASIGYAVDGYLKDASVKCDASSVVVKTDSAGFFRFPDGCSSTVTLTGGTNIDTLLPFTGTLKAPAGSKMVTPLTTLLVGGMTQDQVNASLGLPAGTDLINTDPALTSAGTLVNPDLLKKTLALQQLLLQTTEAMAAFAGLSADTASKQAIYDVVASEFAAGLKGGAKLNATAATVDLTVLKTLVTAAATKWAASPLAPNIVKAAILLDAKPANFAEVISGAMQAQAEALLTMANADVTATTIAMQTDTNVKTAAATTGFMDTLKAALGSSAVTTQATSLTNSAKAAIAATKPVSGNTGTCTGTTCIGFEATNVGFVAFGGTAATSANDPVDATNKVMKVVKPKTGEVWAGATIYTSNATAQTVAPVGFTANSKTITLRVYSPAAGETIMLKVETGPNAGGMEASATTTKANAWETLTFNYPNFDSTKTYQTISVFPHFNTALAADSTYYFDELSYPAVATSGGGGSGGTTTPVDPNAINFEVGGKGASFGWSTFENGTNAPLEIVANPNSSGINTSAKVAKFTALAAGQPWAGFQSAHTTDIASFPLDATNGLVKMKVYKSVLSDVGFKLVGPTDASLGEIKVANTRTNAWEELSFDFCAANKLGVSPIDRVAIFPDFNLAGRVADTVSYLDDITFNACPSTGGVSTGGGATSTPLVFASDYTGTIDNGHSAEGGSIGQYIDTSAGIDAQWWWGGIASLLDNPPPGDPSFNWGWGILGSATHPTYFGGFVKAPANGTAAVSSYANLKISVWGNDELVNTHPHFTVILKGPTVNACTSELKGDIPVLANGVQTYTLPLSGFTQQTACGYSSVTQAIAAGVTEVHVQVLGANMQYVIQGGSTGRYANGLNIGKISFIN